MFAFDWCCSFYLRTILRLVVSLTVINIKHTLDDGPFCSVGSKMVQVVWILWILSDVL